MTPGSGSSASPGEQDSNETRLNAVLYVVALLCLCAVVLASVLMSVAHSRDDGDRSGNWLEDAVAVVKDDRVPLAVDARAGEDVGGGSVEAMKLAPEAEQQRTAAQIEAATKMVDAFLNIQYQHVQSNIEAVKALATGPFLKQYTHASDDLVKLTRRAKATQTGEVEWAGLVDGDDDSADVVVATTGTVKNKVTHFKPQARDYRLQLRVQYVDGQWLTSDLQYVR